MRKIFNENDILNYTSTFSFVAVSHVFVETSGNANHKMNPRTLYGVESINIAHNVMLSVVERFKYYSI